MRYKSIRHWLSTGVIALEHVKSKENLADYLTKGLSKNFIISSLRGMGLKPIKSLVQWNTHQGNSISLWDIALKLWSVTPILSLRWQCLNCNKIGLNQSLCGKVCIADYPRIFTYSECDRGAATIRIEGLSFKSTHENWYKRKAVMCYPDNRKM